MHHITVVFPAYNEEDIIEKTVHEAAAYLKRQPFKWDILIVNNCSTDNTGHVIDRIALENSNVRVIHHPSNLGYAMSINTGLRNTSGDITFIIDSDGQHTIEDIDKFIAKIEEGYELVFGWKKKRYDPFLRLIISRVLNYSSRVILNSKLNDINCGFRAFTRKAADAIEMRAVGNIVGPELYVDAVKNRLKITEVVVRHFPRKSGKSVHIVSKLPQIFFKSYAMLFELRKELSAVKK